MPNPAPRQHQCNTNRQTNNRAVRTKELGPNQLTKPSPAEQTQSISNPQLSLIFTKSTLGKELAASQRSGKQLLTTRGTHR